MSTTAQTAVNVYSIDTTNLFSGWNMKISLGCNSVSESKVWSEYLCVTEKGKGDIKSHSRNFMGDPCDQIFFYLLVRNG